MSSQRVGLDWTTEMTEKIAVAIQLPSCMWLLVTLWTAEHQTSLSFTIPRVCSNSRHWVNDAIQPSHPLSSSSPPAVPASGSFPITQFFASGGQSIGVSASTWVFPMNTQDWSPLGWTGWISLQSKGLSRVFSNTTVQNLNCLVLSFLPSPTLTSIYDHWKNYSLD